MFPFREDLLERRAARRQRREELSRRRTAASQERMRMISQLARRLDRREDQKDDFGRNDDDWDVYKKISKVKKTVEKKVARENGAFIFNFWPQFSSFLSSSILLFYSLYLS